MILPGKSRFLNARMQAALYWNRKRKRADAATVWYVAATGTNGDGLTPATPWVGFSNIDWASIEPGHILDGMGDTFADPFVVEASGDSTGVILVRNIVVDTTADDAITIDDGIGNFYDYITFLNCDVTAAQARGFNLTAPAYTDERHITVNQCDVSGIHGGVYQIGIRSNGRGVKILNTTIHDIGGDGVYHEGARLTLTGCHIYDTSLDTPYRGDCIQLPSEYEGFYIARNTLDLRGSTNPKQCLVARVSPDGTAGVFEYNLCYAQNNPDTTDTKSQCLYLAGVEARYNVLIGGTYGCWLELALIGKDSTLIV